MEIFPRPKLTVPRSRIREIRDFKLLKYIPTGLDIRHYYIYPDEALEFLLRYFEYDISDENWEKITKTKPTVGWLPTEMCGTTRKLESKLTQKVQT